DRTTIEWDERAAVTVVLASAGYPGKYEVGKPISGVETAGHETVHIFHAGTRWENGKLVTAGGRVLAVTALGETVAAARAEAYKTVEKIHFEGCHYRRDIALGAVES
ncbi:MAG: phosphoribosylamine---glycine ligase, partial [Verrucomicrobiota bacterium]